MSVDTTNDDEDMLSELGYKQELHRGMSSFGNFAVSFSIISVLAGCITTYQVAMGGGGPLTLNLGWILCGLMVLCVAMSMAEICSRYPTAGGLYFWSGRLANRHKREWAWYTGWFNFMGEVAVTASIDYGAAVTWMAFSNQVWGWKVTLVHKFLLFVIFILVHGLLNTFGVNIVKILSNVSAWWHLVGVATIVLLLAFVPDHHRPIQWTLFHFENKLGFTGTILSSGVYAFFIGLLMAQYTLTGYDASAHVAEETMNASVEAPKGIVRSVWVSIVAGWLLLMALTWCIGDYNKELAGTTTGLAAADIFVNAAGHNVGLFLIFICGVAQFFCGMASVTANSRMTFAFSRDGAIPGSSLWSKVNPRTGTPTNSIWLCVGCGIVLTTPAIGSIVAFNAVVSVAVIGLYIAYVIPIFLRQRSTEFRQGRWNTGRWSPVLGWISVVWVVVIVILFILPSTAPGNTLKTFNFAPVAVLIVIAFATGMWFATGREHFMRDTPAGHDTRPADEIFKDAVE